MKTLLIPTDFELKSLDCIAKLAQKYPQKKLNIVLVHMLKITDSISELLMLSKRSIEYQKISREFQNNCDAIKQNYAHQINSLRITFFYGNTKAVFDNFLEANGIDEIVILDNYKYKSIHRNSIEPNNLINRCGKKIIVIDDQKIINIQPEVQEELYETDHILIQQNA